MSWHFYHYRKLPPTIFNITLCLNNELYQPHHKHNECLSYVNKSSNCPMSIIDSIIKNICTHISWILANEDALDKIKFTRTMHYLKLDIKIKFTIS